MPSAAGRTAVAMDKGAPGLAPSWAAICGPMGRRRSMTTETVFSGLALLPAMTSAGIIAIRSNTTTSTTNLGFI